MLKRGLLVQPSYSIQGRVWLLTYKIALAGDFSTGSTEMASHGPGWATIGTYCALFVMLFRMDFAVHILACPNVLIVAHAMETSPVQSTAGSWNSGST